MKIIVEFPEDENPEYVKWVFEHIKDQYEKETVSIHLEPRWCTCKDSTFDSYINAKCKKCGGEID